MGFLISKKNRFSGGRDSLGGVGQVEIYVVEKSRVLSFPRSLYYFRQVRIEEGISILEEKKIQECNLPKGSLRAVPTANSSSSSNDFSSILGLFTTTNLHQLNQQIKLKSF